MWCPWKQIDLDFAYDAPRRKYYNMLRRIGQEIHY